MKIVALHKYTNEFDVKCKLNTMKGILNENVFKNWITILLPILIGMKAFKGTDFYGCFSVELPMGKYIHILGVAASQLIYIVDSFEWFLVCSIVCSF